MTTFKYIDDLSLEEIAQVVRIEGSVYPLHMQYMQYIEDHSDLKDYCESNEVSIAMGTDWYIIVSPEEVIDLACASSLTLSTLLDLSKGLREYYGIGTKFSLDARASTSYRLLKYLEKKGTILVHSEQEWDWDGEVMYEMEISYIR